MVAMKSSLEIAQEARLRPIEEVAEEAGLLPDEVEPCGRYKAKVSLGALDRLRDRPPGRIVVVTAITPTTAGEGKTTTAVGLTQGLARVGAKAVACLREPSMGPVFGTKGGGTGGGYAQVVPMEDINLHFTGDFHAVTAAHNLLAAALDASVYHGNPLQIDHRTITWPRTMDVNDRSLRHIIVGLGGTAHGLPREGGFVITAASEVMAILALATDLRDLRTRLGRIEVAQGARRPVSAEDLRVAGAMTAVLRDALRPNLVQTLEGQPVLIHTGPFGNIATANSSILATQLALRLAEVVVTEAGFGSELGFEKFCHIVCRYGGFQPSAAVVVVTVRALKVHGGVGEPDAGRENLEALTRGLANLAAHLETVRSFGVPTVVAVNRFPEDSDRELGLLREAAIGAGALEAAVSEAYQRGGAGAEDLAKAVLSAVEQPSTFRPLNPPGTPLDEQIRRIATRLYGAEGVEFSAKAEQYLESLRCRDLDRLPVCMAKTHLSLSHDPTQKGRPRGFRLPVRDFLGALGAGFVVALCGDILLMPGLGKDPAFTRVDVDETGQIVGLF
jgi:formate--tetrahydrofolate ligase